MGKSDLRYFGFCVITALAIQNRFGFIWIVHHETDRALALLVGELLIGENVDIFLGKALAKLAKRSRPVFEADCELLRDRHDGNLLLLHLGDGLGSSCEMKRWENRT